MRLLSRNCQGYVTQSEGLLAVYFELLQDLGIQGRVELLKTGYHSSLNFLIRDKNKPSLVVKVVSKPEFRSKSSVIELRDDVGEYRRQLIQSGVSVSEILDLEIVRLNGLWSLITIMPFIDYDIERYITDKKQNAEMFCHKILLALLPLFQNRIGCDLPLGIDPKPANFVMGKNLSPVLIDFVPPRYRKLGKPIVEFSEINSPEDKNFTYFRHYDIRGVLLVLQSQISKLAPSSRSVLKKVIRGYAQLIGQHTADFLTNLPVENIKHKSAQQIKVIISTFGPKDVYLLREAACELYADRAEEMPDLVNKVFALTHFVDDLPSQDNINQAKRLILSNL